jgi:hypothetical protein
MKGQRDGAEQRPRQSRRPSAAKSIIRAEVPKDTDPIYLRASFFRATSARHGLYDLDLFAVVAGDQMAEVEPVGWSLVQHLEVLYEGPSLTLPIGDLHALPTLPMQPVLYGGVAVVQGHLISSHALGYMLLGEAVCEYFEYSLLDIYVT